MTATDRSVVPGDEEQRERHEWGMKIIIYSTFSCSEGFEKINVVFEGVFNALCINLWGASYHRAIRGDSLELLAHHFHFRG